MEDSDGLLHTISTSASTLGTTAEGSNEPYREVLIEDVSQVIRDTLNRIPDNEFDNSRIDNITQHFEKHKYAYTRYLLQNIEPERLASIVDTLTMSGVSLGSLVDPIPIGVSQNLIGFRIKQGVDISEQIDPNFEEIPVDNRPVVSDTVFLPTAGVFAEAILGRSNASEYIDPRRFYNWQDSPIPHLAPQINPVQPGANQSANPPGELAPTVPGSNLNIINPAPYAPPSSLAAGFQAIQNPTLLPDMSKSEQLTSILNNLASLANTALSNSTNLTGKAAEDSLQSALALGNKVASMVDSVTNSNTAPPPNNPTEKGAALNVIDEIERKPSQQKEITTTEDAKGEVMGAKVKKNIVEGQTIPLEEDFVDYNVGGNIPVIQQPTAMTCWAAVTTMLTNWRNNTNDTIQQILGRVGSQYLDIFNQPNVQDQGLSSAIKPQFLTDAGLIGEPPKTTLHTNYTTC